MRTKQNFLVPLLAVLGLFTAGLSSTAQAQPRGRTARPARATPANAARTTARTARPAARPAATGQQRTALKPAKASEPHIKSQASFKAALKASESKFFSRQVNGKERLIANVTGQAALNKVSEAMGKNSNVIQILHIGLANIQHTMAIFDGELVHTQYAGGTGNWRLNNWGDMLRASNTKMFSAFIALTGPEAAKLRANIAQGRQDQGPDHLAGPKWANGKLKDTSLGGCRSFNCASSWSGMPLGENGESLGQIAGISASGHPKMLQKALETGGNERIIGVAVYGPKIANFGANPEQPVVEF